VESNSVHSALRSPIGLLCQPRVIMMIENWWNDEWQGKPKYSEKTCPSDALSTTNPTCCPDANPGCRGGKPASNRLSYGTAFTSLTSRQWHVVWCQDRCYFHVCITDNLGQFKFSAIFIVIKSSLHTTITGFPHASHKPFHRCGWNSI
jgi:hypothetical protein